MPFEAAEEVQTALAASADRSNMTPSYTTAVAVLGGSTTCSCFAARQRRAPTAKKQVAMQIRASEMPIPRPRPSCCCVVSCCVAESGAGDCEALMLAVWLEAASVLALGEALALDEVLALSDGVDVSLVGHAMLLLDESTAQ